MVRKVVADVAVGGLVIVALGCGGGAKPLSRAEFVKQADTACHKAQTQFFASVKEAAAHHESQARGRAAVADALHGMIADLKALHPPTTLQDTYTKFVAARSAEFDAMISQSSGDRSAQARQVRETHIAAPLAGKLGLHSC